MDEGVFVGWLKNDGDPIRAGEPIFSLETDKAVQEIESLDAGTLRLLPTGPKPGETLPVGTVIGHIVVADEADVAGALPATAGAQVKVMTPQDVDDRSHRSEQARDSGSSAAGPRSSPRARRKARELGLDWTRLGGSGRGGRVRERDVIAA